jgi:hypothetical protein
VRLREQALKLTLGCLSYDFIGTSIDESSEDVGTVQARPPPPLPPSLLLPPLPLNPSPPLLSLPPSLSTSFPPSSWSLSLVYMSISIPCPSFSAFSSVLPYPSISYLSLTPPPSPSHSLKIHARTALPARRAAARPVNVAICPSISVHRSAGSISIHLSGPRCAQIPSNWRPIIEDENTLTVLMQVRRRCWAGGV